MRLDQLDATGGDHAACNLASRRLPRSLPRIVSHHSAVNGSMLAANCVCCAPKHNRRPKGAGCFPSPVSELSQELALSTVTARRFCDQQEISLQTATGRSLPYEMVRMRCALTPREAR